MVRREEFRQETRYPPFAVAFQSRVDGIDRDLHERRDYKETERQLPGEPRPFLAQTNIWINSLSQPLAIRVKDLRFVRHALESLFMTRSGWGYDKDTVVTNLAAAMEEKSRSVEAIDLLVRAMTRLAVAHPSAHTLMIPNPVGRGPDIGLWRNMAEAFQETSDLLKGKRELGLVPDTLQRASRLLRCRPFSAEDRLEFASVVAIAAQDRVVRAGGLDASLVQDLALRISLAHCLWHGLDVETVSELCSFWQGLTPDKLKSDEQGETEAEKGARERLVEEVPPRLLLEFLAQGIIGEGGERIYQDLGLGKLWRPHKEIVEERRAREFIPHPGLPCLKYSGSFDPTHAVHVFEMALGAAMALRLHTFMVVNQAPRKGTVADFPDRQEMALISTQGLEPFVTVWSGGGADADAPTRVIEFEKEFLERYGFSPEIWLVKGTDDTKLDLDGEYLLSHEGSRLKDYPHVWKLRSPLLRADSVWATLHAVETLLENFGPQTTVLWPTLVGVSGTEIRKAIREGKPVRHVRGDVREMAEEIYR